MRDYNFGNFLHELRERRGLSQFQLGALVGVSDKSVSKWENGSAKPKTELLYQLSDVLGVSVDELLAGEYRAAENETGRGAFATKSQLWKGAHQALHKRYGAVVPVEILNRYLSEFAEFHDTDLIVYFDLLGRINAMASERGEHVYSRGAIGASFIAFVLGASEINPLVAHYYCPRCHKVEFAQGVRCGWDLPAKDCSCGAHYLRDGHDLPFESWRDSIGQNVHFELSVSRGMYQSVKQMIGDCFESNTVVTLTQKGNPTGETIVVVDEQRSDLTDGQELPFKEHYARLRQYASIALRVNEDLDSFRRLEQETQISFSEVDFACPCVLDAFQKGDTDGICEFRTDFAKYVLNEICPTTFHDLIQAAGLTHGTGVWNDNAQRLIKDGRSASEVIAYRDDVFHFIQQKMEAKGISNTGYAYKVMRDTRCGVYAKGGVSDEMKEHFSSLGLGDWFAESIGKICYLFPKAHGALYVKYALILMWYKMNYPEVFKKLFLD